MNSWTELPNDRWKLTIASDDDPSIPPSVYRGTKAEIAEMLAVSQGNANRRIAELRSHANGNGNGHSEPAPPGPLTPGERLQTVVDLSDPAKVTGAIKRAVESEMGTTMEAERARRQAEEAERIDRLQGEAAAAFAQSTPEWYPTQPNKNALVHYMVNNGFDLTSPESYTQAFEDLTEQKLLQPKPEGETETEPEEDDGKPNAPAARPAPKAPARISTGITGRDISGLPPRPTTRLKYSREQLDNMNRADYKQLMLTDRKELERCEQYYATHPAASERLARAAR
jgi:hypothetical protein